MKFNTNGNAYTIIYSVILVTIVAVVLSVAATVLKPAQTVNIETEKRENILQSVGKAADAKSAGNKNEYIKNEYEKYITEAFVVDIDGNRKDGEAFYVNTKAEARKDAKEKSLPVFVCTEDNGAKRYIIPLNGKGLWGDIWGYVALESDMNTIAGAVFDHAGETPGLGAEIASKPYQKQFVGKTIFDGEKLVAITVQKPGPTADNHTIDGISGGTLTGEGVQRMIKSNLENYQAFINKTKSEYAAKQGTEQEAHDNTAEAADEDNTNNN